MKNVQRKPVLHCVLPLHAHRPPQCPPPQWVKALWTRAVCPTLCVNATLCHLLSAGIAPPPADAHGSRHRSRRALGQRSSSGDWSRDQLTAEEQATYRRAMGYAAVER